MPWEIRIRPRLWGLPCGRSVWYLSHAGDYYEMPDGTFLPARTGPVWCRSCRGYTTGELIEGLPELEQEIQQQRRRVATLAEGIDLGRRPELGDFENSSSWFEAFEAWSRASVARDRLSRLETRSRWRPTRCSPPRCLECGSADISDALDGARNPRGPGRLRVTVECGCDVGYPLRFFTPEGHRIEKDDATFLETFVRCFGPPATRPTEQTDFDDPLPRGWVGGFCPEVGEEEFLKELDIGAG
jgi:hypothetical protein